MSTSPASTNTSRPDVVRSVHDVDEQDVTNDDDGNDDGNDNGNDEREDE